MVDEKGASFSNNVDVDSKLPGNIDGYISLNADDIVIN